MQNFTMNNDNIFYNYFYNNTIYTAGVSESFMSGQFNWAPLYNTNSIPSQNFDMIPHQDGVLLVTEEFLYILNNERSELTEIILPDHRMTTLSQFSEFLNPTEQKIYSVSDVYTYFFGNSVFQIIEYNGEYDLVYFGDESIQGDALDVLYLNEGELVVYVNNIEPRIYTLSINENDIEVDYTELISRFGLIYVLPISNVDGIEAAVVDGVVHSQNLFRILGYISTNGTFIEYIENEAPTQVVYDQSIDRMITYSGGGSGSDVGSANANEPFLKIIEISNAESYIIGTDGSNFSLMSRTNSEQVMIPTC